MKKKLLIVFLICCMFFGVASPAFAMTLPSVVTDDCPSPLAAWDNYLIINVYSGSDNPPRHAFVYDNCNLFLGNQKSDSYKTTYIYPVDLNTFSSVKLYQYDYSSSEWNYSRDFTLEEGDYLVSIHAARETLGYCSPFYYGDDVNDSSNWSVFTPPPLTLEQVTVAQMKGAQQILQVLDGNLRILVPFGVGLLALLTVLVLLSKVLRRFLG